MNITRKTFGLKSIMRSIITPSGMARLILAATIAVALCDNSMSNTFSDKPVTQNAGDNAGVETAVRAAVERIAPSVVRLETVGGLQRGEGLVFGTGPTTGLVVDADGHIVSSEFNFLRRPDSILARLADGQRKAARLVATDHSRKLVLLKIELDEKTKAQFAHAAAIQEQRKAQLAVPEIIERDRIRVGQWAIAVGRTFPGNRPNICVGIVSAVNRIWGKAIQTDAAISPNNYGGPLVDIRGRVMGVLVPMSPSGDSQTAGLEWYDSGIGFAIPAGDVWRAVERLKKGRDLYGGFLGAAFKGPNPSISEPVVGACSPGSPAEKAGLKPGDRITRIDGREIARAADAMEAVARHYAGDKITITAMRGGREFKTEIELSKKPELRKPGQKVHKIKQPSR